MSYKEQLSDLTRDGSRSVTGQIVDVIEAAIGAGELAPGEKLPPTRELAELAGVNHLTAARAYRRLAELGLVTGRVGKGTFVRAGAPAAGEGVAQDTAEATGWQLYALPEEAETYAD
jgi:DNA-binding transcriptional regulator YhcF (GntR family)